MHVPSSKHERTFKNRSSLHRLLQLAVPCFIVLDLLAATTNSNCGTSTLAPLQIGYARCRRDAVQ